MVRRYLCILTGILTFFSLALCAPVHAFAEDETAAEDDVGDIDVPCYIVVDQDDPNVVFYEQNADERSIPGSTMKIMTCILALELCDDLDQQVTVTAQAAALKDSNSLMGVYTNETLSVRQLLYGLMLESGNDAALLLAQTFGGSVEGFAALMNDKAADLGMNDTLFINPSGAYKSGQYSTARDMAVLTCYAMQNETFRTIVSTVNYTIEPNDVRKREMVMTNSNKLISDPADSRLFYACATGVKTGSTELGGKCLVASAEEDGAGVVAVLLGLKEGGSKLERMSRVYEDAKQLLDLALSNRFVSVTVDELGLDRVFDQPVSGAEQATVTLEAVFAEDSVRLADLLAERIKADPSAVEVQTDVQDLAAPIRTGDVCGTATYRYNDKTLFTADLIAATGVAAEGAGNLSVVTTPSPVPTNADSGPAFAFPLWLAVLLAVAAVVGVVSVLVYKKKASRKSKSR